MILYQTKILDEFARVIKVASGLEQKFESGISSTELALDAELLAEAYTQLRHSLPTDVTGGNFARHISFIKLYLSRNQPESCMQDVGDIINLDIPELQRSFNNWCNNQQHYDAEFRTKITPLLQERHFDSAVRKSFIILKSRMIRLYGIPENIDGVDLANAVFGQRGVMAGRIDDGEREEMRNLLAGMFGIFRNPYSHNEVEIEWTEVDAILSMVNWILKKLETYPSVAP